MRIEWQKLLIPLGYGLPLQVAPYKKVRRVAFVSKIPKTAAGKILRKDLIKLSTSKL